ncbi:hypothetical protein BC941DRAFT_434501 [Chlamydoabsidia padenii]|nr:hypothetical protein BC941DRAFT_434501 [Chlamydoabsidia padenii]
MIPADTYAKMKQSLLYKTEHCRNWSELGECRYGQKCSYAHGNSELRKKSKHSRYKTQVCRAYHLEGTCPYGLRCTFIHDDYNGILENNQSRQQQSKFFAKSHDQHVPTQPNKTIWHSKLGLNVGSHQIPPQWSSPTSDYLWLASRNSSNFLNNKCGSMSGGNASVDG